MSGDIAITVGLVDVGLGGLPHVAGGGGGGGHAPGGGLHGERHPWRVKSGDWRSDTTTTGN